VVNCRVKIQELIHLHALLFEVREYLEQEGTVPPGAFDAYETQPVRPPHIHRRKEAHETAISLLLNGLDRSVKAHPPPDQVPVS